MVGRTWSSPGSGKRPARPSAPPSAKPIGSSAVPSPFGLGCFWGVGWGMLPPFLIQTKPVTSKKRLRRDLRKPRPQSQVPPPKPQGTVVTIPSAGARSFGSGWRLAWSTFFSQWRRPFALIPIMAVVVVVFSFLKMLLAHMVNLVGFGPDGAANPDMTRLLNQALWNAFGFLIGPMAMTPWFAVRVLFFHRLKTPWRLVMEPLAEPWRWAHLLALGSVWMVLAGTLGAYGPELVESFGVRKTAVGMVGFWLVCQLMFLVATASVWRDRAPAHLALWHGLTYPIRALFPLGGMLLAWAFQMLGVLLVGLLFFGAPMLYMQMEGYSLAPFGFVLLPVIILLVPFVFHQRAVLGLAVLEWGEPSSSKVPESNDSLGEDASVVSDKP